MAELTAPFLAIGGRALLQRGSLDERERNAVADAALVLGAELVEERPLGGERRLVILEKRGRPACVSRAKRRPGQAALCLT